MDEKKIIVKLREDEHYYGEFGQQFLSNSDISTLLTNPLALRGPREMVSAFLVGGYFHTAILEPDKLKKYKIIESSTRNTNKYKELSGGELCLLQHEVDVIDKMIDKVMNNNVCMDLIRNADVTYEQPGIVDLHGQKWKGKADVINHDEKLIIDLKTTGDLEGFKWSANKYNYDSQAYIYSKIFGYEFVFIAIDKKTHQIGVFDCSAQFLERGAEKVEKASEVYDLFYNTDTFDPNQYFINKTL